MEDVDASVTFYSHLHFGRPNALRSPLVEFPLLSPRIHWGNHLQATNTRQPPNLGAQWKAQLFFASMMPVSVDESGAKGREEPMPAPPKTEADGLSAGAGESAARQLSYSEDSVSSHSSRHRKKPVRQPRPNNPVLRRFLGPRRSNSSQSLVSTESRGSKISDRRYAAGCTTPKGVKPAAATSSPEGTKTELSTPPSSPESVTGSSMQETDDAEKSRAAATAPETTAQVDDNNDTETNPAALSPAEFLLRDPSVIMNAADTLCPPIPTERSDDDPEVLKEVATSEALDSHTADADLAAITTSVADSATAPMLSPAEIPKTEHKRIPPDDAHPIPTAPLSTTEVAPAEETDLAAAATSATIKSTTDSGSAKEDMPRQEKQTDETDTSKDTAKTIGSNGYHRQPGTAAEESLAQNESSDNENNECLHVSMSSIVSGVMPEEERDFPHEASDISTGNEDEVENASQKQNDKLPLQSDGGNEDNISLPTDFSAIRNSEIFQKSLLLRRQKSDRSLDFGSITSYSSRRRRTQNRHQSRTTRDRNRSNSSSRRSVRSTKSKNAGMRSSSVDSGHSSLSRDSSSVISTQSYLSLSDKVQSLLELAAKVVASEHLKDAFSNYQKAIYAAGLEIMEINKQMTNLKGEEGPDIRSKKNTFHEDLRLIGIIIGMLRTKMAIVYTDAGDYERAVELCSGATQVHKHQPALKVVHQKFMQQQEGDQIARLMVVIIERLEKAQTCLEEHIQLLKTIDSHSIHVDDSFDDDDISILTGKDILYGMLAGKATDDGSITTYQGDDTLELLSVHAAEQDKHDMAIHYLRDALQVHLVAMGMKRKSVSQSLIRVATMYHGGPSNNRKNEALVLSYFEQTASVLKHSSLGPHARAALLNDMAVIHIRRNDYDEAVKYLLDALRAYDEEELPSVGQGGKPRAPLATLYVWRNLGDCYMALRRFRSAEGAFLRALEIQKESRKVHLAAEDLNLSMIGLDKSMLPLVNDANITDTMSRVGKARAAFGDHNRALDIYQEALTVINRNTEIPKTDCMENALVTKSDQLSNVLYYIAESCRELSDFERARRMYNLSLGLRTSGSAYRNDKRKSSRIHCILCFMGIGNVYAKEKEFPNAVKQYREALSYAFGSGIKEDHPIVLSLNQHIKDVANSMKGDDSGSSPFLVLERKADNEIERGELDSATETMKELLVLRRAALQELKSKGQETADQVYAIACLLQTFGFVFAKNGDDENAERAFKDAARLFKKRGNKRAEV